MNFKKLYLTFNGRVSRKQYWLGLGLLLLITMLINLSTIPFMANSSEPPIFLLMLMPLWAVFLIAGSFACHIKRFHDIGRSGWWVLISAIPAIGSVIILIQCGCIKGTVGSNKYGEDPLK